MRHFIGDLPCSSEISAFGIMHLKRFLHKSRMEREGKLPLLLKREEALTDQILMNALGLEPAYTLSYLFNTQPDLPGFARWITASSGLPSPATVERFNQFIVAGVQPVWRDNNRGDEVLTAGDIDHWHTNGYVILHSAVSLNDCADALEAICNFLGVERDTPASWFATEGRVAGIKVAMFHHPSLSKLRNSKRIRIAFEQLWQRRDIWLQTDTAGFCPPEGKGYSYPGHGLHWDVSLQTPVPFSTQGLLYLTDTEEEQGALALVPGFQHKLQDWLSSLPADVHPREQVRTLPGAKRIGGKAGDMVIWQQSLPHGSTPNLSDKPRFVQYINYLPADRPIHTEWI